MADFADEVVAFDAAEAVVDELQPVDVAQQVGVVLAFAAVPIFGVRELHVEQGAVRKTRKPVVEGLLAKCLFIRFSVGDIGNESDRAAVRHGFAEPWWQWRCGYRHPEV